MVSTSSGCQHLGLRSARTRRYTFNVQLNTTGTTETRIQAFFLNSHMLPRTDDARLGGQRPFAVFNRNQSWSASAVQNGPSGSHVDFGTWSWTLPSEKQWSFLVVPSGKGFVLLFWNRKSVACLSGDVAVLGKRKKLLWLHCFMEVLFELQQTTKNRMSRLLALPKVPIFVKVSENLNEIFELRMYPCRECNVLLLEIKWTTNGAGQKKITLKLMLFKNEEFQESPVRKLHVVALLKVL